MWLFTLIAFAIITATTASAITVVIIIFSFLCSSAEPSCFRLQFYIILLQSLLPETFRLDCSELVVSSFQVQRSCLFFEYRQQWDDKMMKNGLFLTHVNKWQLGAWCRSTTVCLFYFFYFTYLRISLLFLLFLAGSGMNPSVSPVFSVIAWKTAAA